VRARRADALTRNDDDAPAIKELDAIIESISDAIRWMNDRLEES
jgi:hypothetical protein